MTNNNICELGDLEPLKELKHLKYISLLGNPVREKKWYREWLAWRIPGLRVIDFQRIRDKVRSHAPYYSTHCISNCIDNLGAGTRQITVCDTSWPSKRTSYNNIGDSFQAFH